MVGDIDQRDAGVSVLVVAPGRMGSGQSFSGVCRFCVSGEHMDLDRHLWVHAAECGTGVT
jgi:hypothetical protein